MPFGHLRKSIISEERVEFEISCTKDLLKNNANMAKRVASLAGNIKLAFARGYQAGYEDKVMGKKPRHYTRTTKKSIKGKS